MCGRLDRQQADGRRLEQRERQTVHDSDEFRRLVVLGARIQLNCRVLNEEATARRRVPPTLRLRAACEPRRPVTRRHGDAQLEVLGAVARIGGARRSGSLTASERSATPAWTAIVIDAAHTTPPPRSRRVGGTTAAIEHVRRRIPTSAALPAHQSTGRGCVRGAARGILPTNGELQASRDVDGGERSIRATSLAAACILLVLLLVAARRCSNQRVCGSALRAAFWPRRAAQFLPRVVVPSLTGTQRDGHGPRRRAVPVVAAARQSARCDRPGCGASLAWLPFAQDVAVRRHAGAEPPRLPADDRGALEPTALGVVARRPRPRRPRAASSRPNGSARSSRAGTPSSTRRRASTLSPRRTPTSVSSDSAARAWRLVRALVLAQQRAAAAADGLRQVASVRAPANGRGCPSPAEGDGPLANDPLLRSRGGRSRGWNSRSRRSRPRSPKASCLGAMAASVRSPTRRERTSLLAAPGARARPPRLLSNAAASRRLARCCARVARPRPGGLGGAASGACGTEEAL